MRLRVAQHQPRVLRLEGVQVRGQLLVLVLVQRVGRFAEFGRGIIGGALGLAPRAVLCGPLGPSATRISLIYIARIGIINIQLKKFIFFFAHRTSKHLLSAALFTGFQPVVPMRL